MEKGKRRLNLPGMGEITVLLSAACTIRHSQNGKVLKLSKIFATSKSRCLYDLFHTNLSMHS